MSGNIWTDTDPIDVDRVYDEDDEVNTPSANDLLVAEHLQKVVSRVAGHLPEGFEISLCIENGAAWVTLYNDGLSVKLPDSADKTLLEQLNDALCVANDFK